MHLILAAIQARNTIGAREAAIAHVDRVAEIARGLLAEGHEQALWRKAG
jgi:DNA-binding FadR family transcriptional regulator